MKLIFSIIMTSIVFVPQNFATKQSKDSFKKNAFSSIKHLVENVLVYNRNAESLDYEKLLQKKRYLSDNIYTEKYPTYDLEPDDEKNTFFRVFTDTKNVKILFVCKEDCDSRKRYFIDNKDDNIYYVFNDKEKKVYKYLEKNISYDDKIFLKSFIAWAQDIILYLQSMGYLVDPILFSKLKNFGELKDE